LEREREREREREQIRAERDNTLVQKNTILIQKLNQRQEIFDNLIRQKDLELTEAKDLLESKSQTIIELSQTVGVDQNKIKILSELLTQREKEVRNLTKQLTNKQNKLNRTKHYWQNRLNNLESKNKDFKVQLTYYKGQDNKLRQTILTYQDQINNHVCSTSHTCPPCPLIHLSEPHVCPIINKIDCSHSDYETIKEQRDSYWQQLTNLELAIIQRLNTAFNLDEKDLNQIIIKLKELINKPPLTITNETIQQELVEAQETIIRLERELKEKATEKPVNISLDTPFGEDLKKIIQIDLNGLEQELNIPLSSIVKEQIKNTTTYQELSSLRNKEIKSYLEKKQTGIVTNQQEKTAVQPFRNERVIWISLLVVSLLAIGGLLIKLRKKRTNKPF
jgi:cellobiose-specific phosphotransferase system component IIA